MTQNKTVYMIDRVFFHIGDRKIYGDMSFSFCDAPDTMGFDLDALRETLKYGISCEIQDGTFSPTDPEEIAIYQVLQSVAQIETDPDDTTDPTTRPDLWHVVDAWKIIEEHPVCSEERAAAIGLPLTTYRRNIFHTI